MAQDFTHKVALVTGGGSGIGEACATRLAARGATVVIADIAEEAARQVARKIRSGGGTAHVECVDVADHRQVEDTVARIARRFGGLHVAVNNAADTYGDLHMVPMVDLDYERFRRLVAVNLGDVFACMHAGRRRNTSDGRLWERRNRHHGLDRRRGGLSDACDMHRRQARGHWTHAGGSARIRDGEGFVWLLSLRAL